MPGPTNPLLHLQWGRQVDGALRFLERLPKEPLPFGKSERWRLGVSAYYKRKVKEYLDNAPPGVEQEIKAFKQRLAKV